jgi:alkanesulfonate monooxygenase SsuD/methylene tetrahydromethanopterin reductase-like flavin-dependent oxidoreductase (luciferase family)
MDDSPSAASVRRGVWLFPGVAADVLVDAVVAAENSGLDEVWIADEGVGREPLTVLAAAAARTRTIRLSVGITSPVLRHPGVIAATVATLDELSTGRAVLGLGVGGWRSLEPLGLSADRPVGMLRDAIATARAVLGVERTERYDPPEHAFGPRPVPIWVGSRGPQLTRLAARYADGIFLSGCTRRQHEEIIGRVRRIRPIEIAIYQSAATDDPRDTVVSWETVGERLATEMARHHPAAVGINLVELDTDPRSDAVELVERAAEILAAT